MTLKLVVDSSVIVKWLNSIDEENLAQSDKVLADALEKKVEILAPELAKYEVGNTLLLRKKLSSKKVEIPLHTLFAFPIQFIAESEDLARETFSLAESLRITYYDASFLSLAKKYNATLVTDNIKHQGKSTKVKVKSLQDY
jgi:predicted nucleic acid-binding protein